MKHLVFLATLLVAIISSASDPGWISHGPYGGYFQSFFFHPEKNNVVFASSFDGLFRSVDSGVTWERLNLPGGEFNVRIHALKPDQILATNYSKGLFLGTDLGDKWEQIYQYSFDGDCFYDIEFHPTDPSILYAVTYYHGVYKSTDGGRNWTPRNSNLNLKNVADCCVDIPELEVNPENGNIIYVLLPSRRVYKTEDGGTSWQSASGGFNFRDEVHALAIDPKNTQTLYVGGSGGIFRSTDGGKTWTSRKCECLIWDLAVDPVHSKTVYAVGEGSLKSEDGFKTWEWLSPHPFLGGVLLGIGIHPKNPNLILVGGFGGGIFRSENGGRNWKTANQDLDALNIVRLQTDPIDPKHLFAIGGQQPFETRDGGITWDLFMKGQVSTFWISDLAIHPRNSNLIVAAGYRKKASGAVTLSTDGGKSWEARSDFQGVNYGCNVCVALDPNDEKMIYLAPFRKEKARTIPLGVAKSGDQGKTWNLLNDGLTQKDVWLISIHPGRPGILFAGTGSGKLFRSANNGLKWEDSSKGLDNTSIRAIAYDPKNPDVIYLATYSSLFKSEDGGKSWTSKSKGMPDSWFNYIGLDPDSSRTIYAAGGAGIFISLDAGETWSSSELGSPGPFAVWNLLIQSGSYYAGTDRGVFQIQTAKSAGMIMNDAPTFRFFLHNQSKPSGLGFPILFDRPFSPGASKSRR